MVVCEPLGNYIAVLPGLARRFYPSLWIVQEKDRSGKRSHCAGKLLSIVTKAGGDPTNLVQGLYCSLPMLHARQSSAFFPKRRPRFRVSGGKSKPTPQCKECGGTRVETLDCLLSISEFHVHGTGEVG